MAPIIPIITAVAGAASIASSMSGMFGKKDKANVQQGINQNAPSQANAQASAQDEMNRRRKASLLSGGNTDITRGSGVVNSNNVGKKTLVGA